jgi:hypothetical protein
VNFRCVLSAIRLRYVVAVDKNEGVVKAQAS